MPVDCEGSGEQGYILLIVIFLCTLIVLSLAIAAPKVKFSIQRDRDIELRHRGMQYARAVKLYYKKFGSYPMTVAQLQTGSNLNTSTGFGSSGGTGFDSGASSSAFGSGAAPNQQKFLRRLYPDPITGKTNWRLVYFGQVGTGGNTNPNCAQSGSTALSGSLAGNSQTPTNDPTAAPASGSTSGSSTDCSSSGGLGTPAANAGFSNSGNNNSNSSFGSASSSFGGSSGSSGSGFSSPGGSSNGSSGSIFGSSNTPGTGTGPNGQPQAGPIVGVASLSRKESIIEIKGKNHYNDLEFVYDPTQDFGGAAGGTSVGGNNSPTNPFGSPGSTSGGPGSPSSGFGTPSSGTGNSPQTPITPQSGSGSTQ